MRYTLDSVKQIRFCKTDKILWYMNRLPTDILRIIVAFHLPVQYTLRTDIDSQQLHRGRLMTSARGFRHVLSHYPRVHFLPCAVWCQDETGDILDYLLSRSESIYVPSLFTNPCEQAVTFIFDYPFIDWSYACQNSNERMVDRLLVQFDLMYWNTGDVEWWKKWHRVAFNPNDRVVDYFLEHTEYISGFLPFFWKNENERLLQFLWENYHLYINWPILCSNESELAVDIMLAHLERVEWVSANENSNPRIVRFLIEHPSYIIPISFSKNRSLVALNYMIAHPVLIDWYSISNHPHLFVPDQMETRNTIERFVDFLLPSRDVSLVL